MRRPASRRRNPRRGGRRAGRRDPRRGGRRAGKCRTRRVGCWACRSSCPPPSASSMRCWRATPRWPPSAGDHRFDDRLPDLSPGAVAERVTMLRDAADALAGIDPDAFDAQDQVDHAILSAMVERGLFELTDVREHEWNPLEHNPGPLLHAPAVAAVRAGRRAADQPGRPAGRDTGRAGHRPRGAARRPAGARRDGDRSVRRHGRADPRRAARHAGRRSPACARRSSRPPRPRSTRWTSSATGCAAIWSRPGAIRGWAARCGRRGCGTPSTPSCPPPRCSPGPSDNLDAGRRGAARGGRRAGRRSGHRRDGARGAGHGWPPSTRTTPRSSTWPR